MVTLKEGMDAHQRVVENGFTSNATIVNALIDMYVISGIIHKARELFYKMHDANTISWIAIIGEYAIHGYNKDYIIFLIC